MSDKKIRVGVIGVGDFGRNHVRVLHELAGAELIGLHDTDPERARQIAAEFSTDAFVDVNQLIEQIDAACVAAPTVSHARLATELLERGVDVLVEKPMTSTLAEADALIAAAKRNARILQVGHLERFNPAVVAVKKIVSRPLFFEVHRLGIFSPRSLDVDVVFDVMIHDLDILLSLVASPVADLRAVGIPVLTDKVDIAHARIEFASGCVANLTASRVSTERVRKLRFFQAHEYVSVDYTRQDVVRVRVVGEGAQPAIDFEKVPTQPEEPLKAELRSFLAAVRDRTAPLVDGEAGRRALELADSVMQGILEHAARVQPGVAAVSNPR
ncbi:MAG TPA: Gfo/Idh/MocA family oxidoreductase [Candidatus Acidoferrales bacterium]|nr:Gfo/Idh/MocA family oxidoreductase [Candidatus Acidoferrales bacterium]